MLRMFQEVTIETENYEWTFDETTDEWKWHCSSSPKATGNTTDAINELLDELVVRETNAGFSPSPRGKKRS